MRVLCCLLLALDLLFIHDSAGSPSNLFDPSPKYDQYHCAKRGGTCHFSPCPLYTHHEGTCYSGKAKCCMR